MNNSLKHELELFAVKERMLILEGIYNAKAGHPGGSLSIAELMAYLYNVEMKVDPANPKWEDRDRFVLSKGHAAPALYLHLRAFSQQRISKHSVSQILTFRDIQV